MFNMFTLLFATLLFPLLTVEGTLFIDQVGSVHCDSSMHITQNLTIHGAITSNTITALESTLHEAESSANTNRLFNYLTPKALPFSYTPPHRSFPVIPWNSDLIIFEDYVKRISLSLLNTTQITNSLYTPDSMEYSAFCLRSNLLYLYGAQRPSGFEDVFSTYNFETNTWDDTIVNQNGKPSARAVTTFACDSQDFFIYAGNSINTTKPQDLYQFTFSSNQWNYLGIRGENIGGYGAVWDSGSSRRFVVVAGVTVWAPREASNDIQEYIIDSASWNIALPSGTPMVPSGQGTSIQVENSLYIYGGANGGGTPMRTLYRLDYTSIGQYTWNELLSDGGHSMPQTGHANMCYLEKHLFMLFDTQMYILPV